MQSVKNNYGLETSYLSPNNGYDNPRRVKMAQQAQEMVVDATPKKTAFVSKPSTHEERIKRDKKAIWPNQARKLFGKCLCW